VPVLRARRGKPAFEPLPVSLVLSVPGFEEGTPPFVWPVTGPVTSTFGRRSRSWHRGVDIGADRGAPIVASAAGVVVASGFEARYGQRVMIEHEGGFATVYAHNERNLVDIGQEVSRGQVIAVVGRTGRASGEHVHFEIRYDGRVYNPLYLLPLPPRTVQIELVADSSDDDE
jgi:murein DD-endopeptidase MepM/ murein hydrolase activator NlpD